MRLIILLLLLGSSCDPENKPARIETGPSFSDYLEQQLAYEALAEDTHVTVENYHDAGYLVNGWIENELVYEKYSFYAADTVIMYLEADEAIRKGVNRLLEH